LLAEHGDALQGLSKVRIGQRNGLSTVLWQLDFLSAIVTLQQVQNVNWDGYVVNKPQNIVVTPSRRFCSWARRTSAMLYEMASSLLQITGFAKEIPLCNDAVATRLR
jgi:hypothetical protein